MPQVSSHQYGWTRFWFIILFGVLACMIFTAGFFIFTTRMSKPTAMQLFLPKDAEKPEQFSQVKASGVLTLLLGRNDVVYFYEGELAADASNIKQSNYSDIRKVILDKKSRTDAKEFVVVIKPAEGASYKNTVDILDEMTINDVKRYAMVDISLAENELINKRR